MNHQASALCRTASSLAPASADRSLPRSVNAIAAACLVLAVGLSAGSARASPVTYTGSVSSPQGLSFPCLSPSHAGDGSGLAPGIVDGVTPWTTTQAALHSNSGCNTGFAIATLGSVQYTLDLGTIRAVDMLGYWAGDIGVIANPAQNTFKLTAGIQAASGNPLASVLGTFTAAGSAFGNTAMQAFSFAPVTARYLQLDFASATSIVAIGELAAREAVQVPEPGSLALAGLGLLALGVRRRRAVPGRAALATAALLAGAVLPAQAGYITWAPGYGYTLSPSGLPTALGNHAAGGTPTGNPNVVTAATPLTPGTSISLHTYADPNPAFAEVEYELVWTLTNVFGGMPMYTVNFWTQTFGNLLQYDGGASGAALDSAPWATQGSLVPGSWTASGLQFDMGPGGLLGGQSATFHLPLDVLGPGDRGVAASNVMAEGLFDPRTPQPVPEPGGLALAGLALAALACVQRRRNRPPG